MNYLFKLRQVGSKQRMQVYEPELSFAHPADIFGPRLNEILAKIQMEERYNTFFSVHSIHYGYKREFIEGWLLYFDIDGVQKGTEMHVASTVARTVGVDPNKTAVVDTGNGVHVYILLDKPIIDAQYFKRTRKAYTELCAQIDVALIREGLLGHADTSVWDSARVMRLPGTRNIKPGKQDTNCVLMYANLEPQRVVLKTSELEEQESKSDDTDDGFRFFGAIDTPSVLSGCDFLKDCKENQNSVSEPEWYAMLSILGRLENGEALAHEYSREHKEYTPDNTNSKLAQALESAGPRTCKNINSLWGKCAACPNFGKVKSPIGIKGPDFIRTKDIGFREQTKKGPGKPAYEDLVKQFAEEFEYVTERDSERFYTFKGTHWEEMPDIAIRAWVNTKVKPSPAAGEMTEFVERIKVMRVMDLPATNVGLMNFKNGVVNVRTKEIFPHDQKYGFKYVLPFVYDPRAKSPRFDQFLLEIFSDDPETVLMIKEYIGYCFSGDDCWAQKALVLYGTGANGKSALLETLAYVVGENNYAAFPLDHLENTNSRSRLVDKLFFYSEESSRRALSQSESFKTLVAGGKLEVKKLYRDVVEQKITAKAIIATNEELSTQDTSYGLYRRLIIVEMNRVFDEDKRDPFIKERLKEEACGILNSCLADYYAAKERGAFTISQQAKERAIEFQNYNMDSVTQFVQDVVEVTADSRPLSLQEVYDRYKEYCMDVGIRNNLTRNKMTRALKKILPPECRVSDVFTLNNGRPSFRGVTGIRIKDSKEF
jgi:putative DNA primase/helicase